MGTVRNVTQGYRGLNATSGYVELAPGQSVEDIELSADERKSAEKTGYFEFDGKAGAADEGPKAVEDMTKAELESLAKAEGIDLSTGKTKADYLAAIEAARGAPPVIANDDLDKMSDADLRTTVAAVTGKPEADYAATSRDDLLKLARAPAA